MKKMIVKQNIPTFCKKGTVVKTDGKKVNATNFEDGATVLGYRVENPKGEVAVFEIWRFRKYTLLDRVKEFFATL